ncbi:PP2C family protein-serine/threonine phosphatase [Telmatospirillum sp. J64-1]|uniref:PP2C family protein-serine/threonine phosphatase n=1 Tax=Telmatospirillum sp. J64-1 TaxID=2502183 RepID=UPI00115E76D1|nr:fused response regulator/phosphatase [Telmatospirillum sp. J64-1]
MTSPFPELSFSHARVLVVEDSEVNRRLLEALLRSAGVGHILCAADGREGLKLAAIFLPDLIVLDLMMPHMDGFEMCRRLRADPAFAEVPVLIQTALDSADKRGDIFAIGATDLVTKPLHARELVARVRLHLHNRFLIRRLREDQARLEQELALARQMQQDLLPSPARIAALQDETGVVIESLFETSSELGGDLWGMERLPQGRIALFTVDFCGHGTTAALNVFRLHTLMAQIEPEGMDAAGHLGRLNSALAGLLPVGQYATMLYAILDPAEDRLVYAAAAAPSPILGGPEGWQPLDGSGLPLGVLKSAAWENRSHSFPQGSALFLYSDALTESPMGESGAMLGEERILTLLPATGGEARLDSILGPVLSSIHRPLPDDLTAVLLCRP